MLSSLKLVVFTQTTQINEIVSQHFKNILFASWNTFRY